VSTGRSPPAGCLGLLKDFTETISRPIMLGQKVDSSDAEKAAVRLNSLCASDKLLCTPAAPTPLWLSASIELAAAEGRGRGALTAALASSIA
jgi:hypothetical protein